MPEKRDESLDEQLSALHDGELGPDEARELRRRSEDDPVLRQRLAVFGQVDEGLRELQGREVPASLADGLRARIENESRNVGRAPGSRRARTVAPRRIPRGLVGAGIAAAAALALYLSLGSGQTPIADRAPLAIAENEVRTPAPLDSVPRSPVAPGSELADVEPMRPAEPSLSEQSIDPFADASEDEIAIALHYETLADLRMIEDLEMLELLEVLDRAEPRG